MSQITGKLLAIALMALLCVSGDVAGQQGPANGAANGASEGAPLLAADEAESPLLADPKTPDELFAAAVLMQKLARPKLARNYLQRFVESNVDDDYLMALRDAQGPAIFLRLANNPELQPFAKQILDRVNRLTRERASDPTRIDALIADLTGPADKAEVALVSLTNAGPVVVPRMLLQLADPDKADRRDVLIHALGRMGPQIVPALLGAVESPNEVVRVGVFEALGLIGSREAVPHLWHPAFSPDEPGGIQATARAAIARILNVPLARVSSPRPNLANELKRIALEHFRGTHQWPESSDHLVAIWTWSPQAGTVVENRLSPTAASYYVGARFAKQALSFAEEDTELQALFLALTLAAEAERSGRDQRLPTGPGTVHDFALTAGRDIMLDVLSRSLESKNTDSAIAALQVLKQIGSRHQLFSYNPLRSPLIAAMDYPDPRVQLLAATTIVQLDPDKQFPGSENVVAILARALGPEPAEAAVDDADFKRDETAEERAEKAAAAVDWLVQIAASQRTDVFNLSSAEEALMGALADSRLTSQALFVLSAIPSQAVQVRLFEMATGAQLTAELRGTAATYLTAHIQRFGLKLSREQVAALESAWQASADSAEASALAAAVGSLQPNSRTVGSRLKSITVPIAAPPKQ